MEDKAHIQMSDRSDFRYNRLKRWIIATFTVSLFAAIVACVFALVTRQAMCSYRAGLAHDIDQTDHFLNDRNPSGDLVHPGAVLGVPRATLLHNLELQRARLRSLRGLHC